MMNTLNKIINSGLAIALLIVTPVMYAADNTKNKYQGIAHDALYDICFSGNEGLAVGANGLILESHDSGQIWQKMSTLKTNMALLGVACLGEKRIVVGQEGTIFIFKDGTWFKSNSNIDQRLFSVAINEAGLGVAVGGFGTLLRTTDDGINWELLQPNWELIFGDFIEPHIYDVIISQTGVITLVGEFELVLQSIDSGDNWEVVHKGDSSLFSLSFIDDNTGYAVGQNGRVIKTIDMGKNWDVIEVNSSSNLLDVWLSLKGDVIISGIRTMLKSTDSAISWSELNFSDVATSWYSGIASSSLIDKSTMADEKIYLVGHTGRIIEIP